MPITLTDLGKDRHEAGECMSKARRLRITNLGVVSGSRPP